MMPHPIHRLKTLGALSVDDFMRHYWQRQPLYVRGAFPAPCTPISPSALFALARHDEVESRLIRHHNDQWQVTHGPFSRLPSRKTPDWTVLVQGVDLHDDAAHRFLQQFRFIPDARLDDLMISFATDRGGVGAHVDAYDVFLVQGHGRRRWRVAPPGNTTLIANAPLKLLAHFEPTKTWILEPGDLLYLPAGWGHEGVALGDCMTLSVGFRAPSRQEFLSAFLNAASEHPGGADPRHHDRARRVPDQAAHIPDDLANQLTQWATSWHANPSSVANFIGCYLTEPKPNIWFETPQDPLNPSEWADQAKRNGLCLARATRMLWRDSKIFINSESQSVSSRAQSWLQRLAEQRILTADECHQALRHRDIRTTLHTWYLHGWLHSAPTTSK
jgi:50S ribosomal protein L16 3-hydroxylase